MGGATFAGMTKYTPTPDGLKVYAGRFPAMFYSETDSGCVVGPDAATSEDRHLAQAALAALPGPERAALFAQCDQLAR